MTIEAPSGKQTADKQPQTAEVANVVKVTVNLPEGLAQRFRKWAQDNGKTFTTALREAIKLRLFVSEQLEDGAKLLVEEPDGKIRQIEFY
jgi:predicted DNA-binding protein